MNLVSALNDISQRWFDYMCASFIDTALLLVLVGAIWLLLRKRLLAKFGYWLFLLVLLKAMVPMETAGPRWLAAMSPRHYWAQAAENGTMEPADKTELNELD